MTAWRRSTMSPFGMGSHQTSTIKALLLANVIVYLFMLLSNEIQQAFYGFFGLVPALAIPKLHLWQFFTYMFLHGGFLHLLLNMFVLWMFGSELEALWGKRVFLQYYFVCGVGGGLTYVATTWGSHIPLVGASGAIFGILLAYGLLFPNRRILLYFLFPIKAKYFVFILGVFELLAAQQQRVDGIGHFAHLGGMLFGYLFLASGLVQAGGLASLKGRLRTWRPATSRRRPRMRVVRGKRESETTASSQRVDQILEKISRQGLDSLTEEEQKILRQASRRH
jgi:membrane associated rhomboid family serine protease